MPTKPKIAIVFSQFNSDITGALLRSAKQIIKSSHEVELGQLIEVPGAFEIPMAAKLLAVSPDAPEAIVCLGAVIQGETDQNVHLFRSVMITLQKVQIETGVPICTGLISAKNSEIARRRTEGELDRGREAAQAALAMVKLKRELGKNLINAV